MILQNIINTKKYAHLSLLSILFVLGCKSTTELHPSANLFSDQNFPNYQHYKIESTEEIFKLSQAAIDFVDETTAGKNTDKQKVKALVKAIFDRSNLSIEYLIQANTTASQTYAAGSANCLSLTILVHSMSQYLGLESEFRKVEVPKFWSRRNGNTLLNEHINLVIKPDSSYQNLKVDSGAMTVDFDPNKDRNKFKSKILTKKQIVSHFYANKAAEAMISVKYDLAYAYLKAALTEDITNDGAWTNLGVLYSRSNLIEEAESTYLSLKHSKNYHSTALENLAFLYHKTDRAELGKRIERTLQEERAKNPFYHKMLGDKAFEEGKYELAIKYFKVSIAINRRPHIFHYSLAEAYLAMGDIKNTRRYLLSAKRYADDLESTLKYESKLTLLANNQAS